MRVGTYIRTDKHRERAKQIMKEIAARPRSNEHCRNISEALSGVAKTDKHRQNVSNAMRGITYGVRICDCCALEFNATGTRQRFCFNCSSNRQNYHLFVRYGLTATEYSKMLIVNNGLCWICLKRKAKVVDHCHKTRRVRGLLCKFCNIAISILDNSETNARAVAYLSSDSYIVKEGEV